MIDYIIVNAKNEKIYHDAFVSDGKYGNIKGWKPSIDEREIGDLEKRIKMDKNLKYKTIDIMKRLLDYAKLLPTFMVEFDIIANNKLIEEYIITTVDRTDWEGRPFTDDEVQNNIYNAIKRFHDSKGYNPQGDSTLTMRKIFTLQNISYDDVYEIVSGNCKSMPNEYKFVGEMKLVEFNSKI